tara:strand:- start:258 stop:1364 length:1107 start_codon:yes stop_codon:yes gene_type:complete
MYRSIKGILINALHTLPAFLLTIYIERVFGLAELGKYSSALGIIAPIFTLCYFNIRVQGLRLKNFKIGQKNLNVLYFSFILLMLFFSFIFNNSIYIFPLIILKIAEGSLWFFQSKLLQRDDFFKGLISEIVYLLIFITLLFVFFGEPAYNFILYFGSTIWIMFIIIQAKNIFKFNFKGIQLYYIAGINLSLSAFVDSALIGSFRYLSYFSYGEEIGGKFAFLLLLYLPVSIISMTFGHIVLALKGRNVIEKYIVVIYISFILISLFFFNFTESLISVFNNYDYLFKFFPLILLIAPIMLHSNIKFYDLLKIKSDRIVLFISLISALISFLSVIFVFNNLEIFGILVGLGIYHILRLIIFNIALKNDFR